MIGELASTQKDWARFYADATLKGEGLSTFSGRDPEMASFRHPRLVWSDVAKAVRSSEPDMILLVCDVLVVDRDIEVEVPCSIFARQILVHGGRSVLIDRTPDPDAVFSIVCQDIRDASDGQITDLPVSIVYEDDAGETQESEDIISAVYSRPAAYALVLPEGATALVPELPAIAAEDWLVDGEPLPLMLNTQFFLAGLHFETDPAYARQILEWISRIVEGNEAFFDLATQSHTLHQTILGLAAAREQGCILVPALDHQVYADEAKACLNLLNRRQDRLDRLKAIRASDANWAEDAKATLEDHQNDADLARQLEEQAEATREHAMQARILAMKDMVEERNGMAPLRAKFDTGVEHWRQSETLEESLNLVQEVGGLLAQIPAIVVAGPELAAGPVMETAKAVADATIEGAKLAAKWPKQAANTVKNANRDKPKLRVDAPSKVPGERGVRRVKVYKVTQSDDNEPTLKQTDAFDFQLLHDSPMPGIFDDDFDSYINSLPTEKWGEDGAKKKETVVKERRSEKETKEARAKAQAEMAVAIKSAGKSAVGIGQSIMKLVKIQQQAADLEAASQTVLDRVIAETEVSLAAIDPVGVDVATGGAQVYDLLEVEIENVFETVAGGVMSQIEGGNAYHQGFKRLIVKGRAMCFARLALAKANSDLATATLQRRAAKKALKIFKERQNKLSEQVLKDDRLIQAAEDRLQEQKRGVFLAMDAYRRAFRYFTLAPDSHLPALPHIAAPVDAFNEAVERLVSRKLELATLNTMYGGLGQFDQPIRIDDPHTLAALRGSKGGLVEMPAIPLNQPEFRLMRRLRLDEIEVRLDGLDPGQPVAVTIVYGGHFRDREDVGVLSGLQPVFMTKPSQRLYIYQPGKDKPLARAKAEARFRDGMFKPTPFADWSIQVTAQDGAPIDLSGVKAIDVTLHGENAV